MSSVVTVMTGLPIFSDVCNSESIVNFATDAVYQALITSARFINITRYQTGSTKTGYQGHLYDSTRVKLLSHFPLWNCDVKNIDNSNNISSS